MNSCLKIGGIIGAGLVVLVSIAVFLAFRLTGPAVEVAEKFLGAVRDERYEEASTFCNKALMDELSGRGGLKPMLEAAGVHLKSWSISSRNTNNDRGQIEGTATMKDGSEKPYDVVLYRENDQWRVAGFHFKPKS